MIFSMTIFRHCYTEMQTLKPDKQDPAQKNFNALSLKALTVVKQRLQCNAQSASSFPSCIISFFFYEDAYLIYTPLDEDGPQQQKHLVWKAHRWDEVIRLTDVYGKSKLNFKASVSFFLWQGLP